MKIRVDDLTTTKTQELLAEHLRGMADHSPAESVHALSLEGLRDPAVTFWTVWEDGQLLGCGALKELDAAHGEIKSMRTAREHLGKGVAGMLVVHILNIARQRGYTRVSLETGSGAAFEPAHALYRKYGFEFCGPFADYEPNAFSRFMCLVFPPAR